MAEKQKIAFIGGCNAEAIANVVLDRFDKGQFLYRVPNAVLLSDARPMWSGIYAGEDAAIKRRLRFEAVKDFKNVFFDNPPAVVVIDFWRDIYIPLILFRGAYFSVAKEFGNEKDFYASLVKDGGYIHPLTERHFSITSAYTRMLASYLAATKIQCVIYACHPVRRALLGGSIVAEKMDSDVYAQMYPRYQEIVKIFIADVPNTIVLNPNALEVYSSHDAPWGLSSLHLDPVFYQEQGSLLLDILEKRRII